MEILFSSSSIQFTTLEKQCSPKEFLLMHPRGVYTLGISNMNDFHDHAKRLTRSVLDFYSLRITDDDVWKLYNFAVSIMPEKFRFTILLYLMDGKVQYCMYADMPQVQKNSYKSLWIYGAPRENPLVKETGWMRKRQYIIDKMPMEFQEAILHQDQYFYEGLTSNICFVFDSGLKTPNRSLVLPGLFLEKVERLCKTLSIPFEEGMVSFDDVRDCIGVFITSILLQFFKFRYGTGNSMGEMYSVKWGF